MADIATCKGKIIHSLSKKAKSSEVLLLFLCLLTLRYNCNLVKAEEAQNSPDDL